MAVVYEAEQRAPRRRVALKVVRGGPVVDDAMVRMFRREVQALALLRHPSIAALYESGRTHDGRPFFAMELVRGEALTAWAERVRGERLDAAGLRQMLTLFQGICEAVHVVLYEMLTGRLPHDLDRAALHEAARIITESPPFPVARFWRGTRRLDADVATIVHKALEKDPAQRYSSAASLAEDIHRYLNNEPILARPPSAAYQMRKLVARNKLAFAFALSGVVLMLGFAVSMAVLARHVAAERDRANAEAARAGDEARTLRLVSEALLQIVRGDRPDENPGNTTLGPETLERMVERVGAEPADKPTLRTKLLFEVATSLVAQGEYRTARKLLAEGIALGDGAGVPDTDARQVARLQMGEIDLELARWAEAVLSWYVDATLREQGPKSAVYAYALEDMGCLRREQGRFAEAEDLLRRALDRYTSLSMPYADLVASVHDSLGNLYLAEGLYPQAETAHRKAMDLRRGRVSNSPGALRSLHYVGKTLTKLRRFDEAGEFLRIALDRRESVLGPDHPDVARTLQALAELDIETRHPERAGPRLARSRAILERQYDPDHPVLADQAFLEGRWNEATNDRAAAASRFRDALAIGEDRWPAGHPFVNETRVALARVLRWSGRDDEARLVEARDVGAKTPRRP